MKYVILYAVIAAIALAYAPMVVAKLRKAVFTESGLIKLKKSQRLRAALMTNDAELYGKRIDALNMELTDLMEQAEVIQNTAMADGRDLTPDESTLHGTLMSDFENKKGEVNRLEKMVENASFLRTPGNGVTPPAPNAVDPQNGIAPVQHPRQSASGRGRIEVIDNTNRGANGFRNMGEFARAVMNGSGKNLSVSSLDPRLLANAPTTFSQESVGADGGFLVPPEYRDGIMKQVMGEDSLLRMCDEFNTSRNSIVVPQDTVNPSGTSGIQAYWEGEADQYMQSKPIFKEKQARLNKLTALVPVTEEMLEDSPLIGSYLNSKAPEVITAKVNDAIVNGTGAGMPTGFMNSGALITVSAEAGQQADSIDARNIDKMWARMHAPSWRNSIWLINQDIMPELDNMFRAIKNVAGTENVGGIPAYMPANGLSASPYGTLKGRPVMPIEGMQTIGDLGDIALVDLRKYMAATKAGGITSDVSMHLWFDYDMAAFKFRFRLAGSPWFDAPIKPKNSANTLSPFVTLAARA